MLRCTEADGVLTFTVRVIPRASKSRVAGEHDGALRVRIAAPPVDGSANRELIRTLAEAFDVPVRDVEIANGMASRVKRIRIRGGTREALEILANTIK